MMPSIKRSRWDAAEPIVVRSVKPRTLSVVWRDVIVVPDEETWVQHWLEAHVSDERLVFLLFRVKNGASPAVRRHATRLLVNGVDVHWSTGALLGALRSASKALHTCEEGLVAWDKLLERVVDRLGPDDSQRVALILDIIGPRLVLGADGRGPFSVGAPHRIVRQLAYVTSPWVVLAAIRHWVEAENDSVRMQAAVLVAVVAATRGVDAVRPMLDALSRSRTHGFLPRLVCAEAMEQMARWLGLRLLSYLPKLVPIAQRALEDEQPLVQLAGCRAVAAIARGCAPFGLEAFEPTRSVLVHRLQMVRHRMLGATMETIAALMLLMDEAQESYLMRRMAPLVVREMPALVAIPIWDRVVSSAGVDVDFLRDRFLPCLLDTFFSQSNDRLERLLKRVTMRRRLALVVTALARRLAPPVVLADPMLRCLAEPAGRNPQHCLALECVEQVTHECPTNAYSDQQRSLLVDGLIAALNEPPLSKVHLVGNIISALGEQAAPWHPVFARVARMRLNAPTPEHRQQGARLIACLARSMHKHGCESMMMQLGALLAEHYGEEYPQALASILEAVHEILVVLDDRSDDAPYTGMISRLVPILRNRDDRVRGACAQLVNTIGKRAGARVPPHEWLRVAHEMRPMLGSQRRSVRFAAVEAYGAVARAVPDVEEIVQPLLACLGDSDRSTRISAMVAVAVIAEQRDPRRTVAVLVEEYLEKPNRDTQTGVMKAVSFLCEYLGGSARWFQDHQLMDALVLLLQDGLVQPNDVLRQLACEATGHLALAVTGLGFERYLMHLANYVWPNVVCLSPQAKETHFSNAVRFAVHALAESLGYEWLEGYTQVMQRFPAKKVRWALESLDRQ